MRGIVTNTVPVARLNLLFIAAKVVKDGNRAKVKYSVHDAPGHRRCFPFSAI
jgi:hypothetical protein